MCPGQTEPVDRNGAADTDDFLARERAALGDDANQFATPQDQAAVAENVDTGNDLLGGAESAPGQQAAPEEVAGFESSFPAVDANEVQNEVCTAAPYLFAAPGMLMELLRTASRPWWYDYRYWTNWLFKLPRARGGAGAC